MRVGSRSARSIEILPLAAKAAVSAAGARSRVSLTATAAGFTSGLDAAVFAAGFSAATSVCTGSRFGVGAGAATSEISSESPACAAITGALRVSSAFAGGLTGAAFFSGISTTRVPGASTGTALDSTAGAAKGAADGVCNATTGASGLAASAGAGAFLAAFTPLRDSPGAGGATALACCGGRTAPPCHHCMTLGPNAIQAAATAVGTANALTIFQRAPPSRTRCPKPERPGIPSRRSPSALRWSRSRNILLITLISFAPKVMSITIQVRENSRTTHLKETPSPSGARAHLKRSRRVGMREKSVTR